MMTPPDLSERWARCSCGKAERSKRHADLAFFVYRGPGSQYEDFCKHCGRTADAHPKMMSDERRARCKRFEAQPGGLATDSFYCGCRGWD